MPTTTGTTMIGDDHAKVICSLDQPHQHETDADRSVVVAVAVPVPVPIHDDCDDAVVKHQNQQPDRDLSALMSRVALPKEQIQQDTMNECSTTSTTAAPTTATARSSIDGVVGNTEDPPSSSPPSRMSRRRRRQQQQRPAVATKNEIPLDETYLQSLVLQSGLPVSAYDLEITKTLRRCWQLQAQHVALQMPEGLLMYATVLVDVLVQGYAHMVNNAWLQQHQQHQQPQQQQPAHEPSADSTSVSNPCPPAPRQQQLRVSILADVTFGACCIDDLGAQAIGADLLVHYGHSCLVPLQHTVVPCLYVFVEIQIDTAHLVDCLMVSSVDDKKVDCTPTNDAGSNNNNSNTNNNNNSKRQDLPYIYLLGTVQFRHALIQALELLRDKYQYPAHLISIPQVKPLSPGEVLGCTSPILTQHHHDHDVDQSTNNRNHHHLSAIVCFVADGRFHLESTMIANHNTIDTFYRYDPYHKRLTVERYDFDRMHQLRFDAIQHVMRMNTCLTPPSSKPVTFGILMGTLGRQGNPALVQRIQTILRQHGKRSIIILLSELSPLKLQRLNARHRIMAWVQIACPRLSIDWGHAFVTTSNGYNNNNNNNNNMSSMVVPVLTPYELMVSLGEAIWHHHHYPMDYYATDGGPWSNYHDHNRHRQWQQQQQQRVVSSSTSTSETTTTITERSRERESE